DMELPVYAGGTRGQLLWTVRKQSRVPQRYRFTLETERSTTPLPACLRVDWADNDDATEGQPLSVDLGGDADEQTRRVVAHAAKGCAAHRYTFPVRVERVTDDGSSVPTTTMRAVHIEVKASKGGGAWIALFIGLGVVIITTFLVRRRED